MLINCIAPENEMKISTIVLYSLLAARTFLVRGQLFEGGGLRGAAQGQLETVEEENVRDAIDRIHPNYIFLPTN